MVMNHGHIVLTNEIVVALFHHQLFVRSVALFVALGMLLLLASLLSGRLRTFNLSQTGVFEPRSRSYLRYAFGLIWLIDGVLQFQPAMPLGLGNDVVAPAMDGAPLWLHAMMQSGITMWNEHPLVFAVGAAWIQVGIGLCLLLSNNVLGRWIAAVSAAWAATIWLFGNGAGGLFSSSGSILFGWPGATLFYVIAGGWLAVSPRVWSAAFSRVTLRTVSVILALGALRQCLPSDGFWHGGNGNALTQMTQNMTQVAQPHWIASLALHGGTVAGTLGGGSNLIVILWLLVTAVGLWLAPQRDLNWPVWSTIVFSVLFWVVAQDAAIFGGLATDLNSLIPLGALTFAAAPKWTSHPSLPRRLPRELRSLTGGVAASFALAMVAYSVVTMAVATLQPPETTFFVASNGLASSVNNVAPGFTLTDQHGAPFTFGHQRGRYTILTFLDPVCYTDCPLMAAQLKHMRQLLPANAPLDIVVVAANPLHESLSDVRHFVAAHQLSSVPHFTFATGPLPKLKAVWNSYGMTVLPAKTGVMSLHADYLFVIDPHGRLRWIMPDDPLSGARYTQTSDEAEILQLLHATGLRS